MKACPVCSLELEDSYLFCPEDGSSLAAIGEHKSSARIAVTEPDDETANVVLYCPACGAEYPLTFSSCPVHGVSLTKQRIRSREQQAAIDSADLEINTEAAVLNRPHTDRFPFVTLHKTTPNHPYEVALANDIAVNSVNSTGADFIGNEQSEAKSSAAASRAIGDQSPQAFLSEAHEPEQHGFRIAAIATTIALAIFALVGLYALVSNLSRRPAPATRPANQPETTEPVPFVVTPQEALDYKEQQPAASEKLAQPPNGVRIVEPERKEGLSPSNEQRDRTTPVAGSTAPSHSPTASPPAAATQASDPPAPVSPRANSGEFDSRLVRARSSRTSSGYRYDLTFNMQEQRGHAAQWQRVLITTRSASGTSHTQAIPFVHRLGATGALTFTISVELTGRSEADWRGRINCTTLGWDNAGAPLQATFVANLTP
jgi:uncharacterized protein YbaR (Trm112 family)